jgi:hypothetical protein
VSQDDLDAIHAALLLGKPVQLPPGTRLAVSIPGDGTVVEFVVPADGHRRTVRPSTTHGLVVLAAIPRGHGEGRDYARWVEVGRVQRVLSLPSGTSALDLLMERTS